MKRQEKRDSLLLMIGSMLVILTLMILAVYQGVTIIGEGASDLKTEEMGRKATVEGYETPEEVVEYVLYQIHKEDLDLALRGCAIREVAENFSLKGYGEILDDFPYTQILAPADYDNKSYIEINQARMTSVYSDMLEQCMGIFGSGYDLEVLRIQSDIPENADGFYYQDIRDIGTISGARDACNVVIDMRIDGVPRQMIVTTAKYKKYWKIIQFSEYKNNKITEPQISEYAADADDILLPVQWESMEGQILPCNYQIAKNRKGKSIEAVVNKIFTYLQRGEVWKILAYYDLYEQENELCPDSLFFERQNRAAQELQEFYYRTMLYNRDKFSWIKQNIKSEAVNLTALLDTSAMIYSDLYSLNVTRIGEGRARCEFIYRYEKKMLNCTIFLLDKNGWKITGITKTGWKDMGDKWYYLDENGKELTGWQTIGGSRYYLDATGIMQTGWQMIDGSRYYLGEDGGMKKGWAKIDDSWYYFNANGVMQTGWQNIYGEWYYLDSETGMMAADIYVDDYYVNADGVWTPEKI